MRIHTIYKDRILNENGKDTYIRCDVSSVLFDEPTFTCSDEDRGCFIGGRMKNKNVYMKTGGELKHRRIALGMTQREVAEKAGMTPQSIIEIEKGRRGMSLETLERLCRVLDLKIKLEQR